MRSSAPARARRLPDRVREGLAAGWLDAALERRRLALPLVRRLPVAVPGRRPAAPASSWTSRLDEGLEWLEALGAPVLERETGNPLTTGVRFDTAGLTDALVRAAGDVRFDQPATVRTRGSRCVLATGGFQGDPELVERYVRPAAPLRLRANPWSAGDGLRAALERGAALIGRAGRVLRPQHGRRGLRRARVRLARAGLRTVRADLQRARRGVRRPGRRRWSEIDLVQATAHQPGARAWYLLDEEALEERVRGRTVRELVAEAPTRTDPAELPFSRSASRPSSRFASRPRSRTRSAAFASTSRAACWTRATSRSTVSGPPGADAGGHLDGRLRERAGLGARARPRGRRERALAERLQVGAAAQVARER